MKLVAITLAAAVLSAGVARCEPLPFEFRRGEVFASPGGQDLKADLYVAKQPGPRPAVLMVHGGAWRFGSRRSMASLGAKLAAKGLTAVTIDYRLAPQHKFPAQIEDCRAALDWMAEQADLLRIDTTRIGAVGMSAGGHLVMLLATDQAPTAGVSLKAVVGLAAPCDFRPLPADERGLAYWLGGTRREAPQLYRDASPAAFASADDPPTLLIHGTADRLVPVASPKRMKAELEKHGVSTELMLLEGDGHSAPIWKPEAVSKTVAFLEKQLATADDGANRGAAEPAGAASE